MTHGAVCGHGGGGENLSSLGGETALDRFCLQQKLTAGAGTKHDTSQYVLTCSTYVTLCVTKCTENSC